MPVTTCQLAFKMSTSRLLALSRVGVGGRSAGGLATSIAKRSASPAFASVTSNRLFSTAFGNVADANAHQYTFHTSASLSNGFASSTTARYFSSVEIPNPPTSNHLHHDLPTASGSLIYTETDEAPALATFSLLPILTKVRYLYTLFCCLSCWGGMWQCVSCVEEWGGRKFALDGKGTQDTPN